MLEVAGKYLFNLITENEEVKKFPQDFVTASMQWIRSWFLKDDPISEAVVNSPGNEPLKKAVIEQKLPALMGNEDFKKELENLLKGYEQQKAHVDQSIHAGGNVQQGSNNQMAGRDIASLTGDHGIQILGSGATIILGSSGPGPHGTSGGGQVAPPPRPAERDPNAPQVVKLFQDLFAQGRSEEIIPKLIAYCAEKRPDLHQQALQISTRWEDMRSQHLFGGMTNSEYTTLRNQINGALLQLIGNI